MVKFSNGLAWTMAGMLALVLAIVLAIFADGDGGAAPEEEMLMPTDDQVAFCDVIRDARERYGRVSEEENSIERDRLQSEVVSWRRERLAEIVPDASIERWSGIVGNVMPGTLGIRPQIRIGLGCDAVLVSRNSLTHDDVVSISKEITVGDAVLVSGQFGGYGQVSEPEFVFYFDEIDTP